jgi:hypothetical protein
MARGFTRSGGGPRPVRFVRLGPVRSPADVPHHAYTDAHTDAHTAATHRHRHRHRHGLRPIPSGRFHRVLWPSVSPILVAPELAEQLTVVLDEFAQASASTADNPMKIVIRAGTMGLHQSGRAADIYEVGGQGIGKWAQEWNAAMRSATAATDPQERARIADQEKTRNIGYKLYKALQTHGGWAQPPGYPVQLFGPWTRVEGPHKQISDRMLKAHRDHIHVAK